jgi:acetyl esterase/lipase
MIAMRISVAVTPISVVVGFSDASEAAEAADGAEMVVAATTAPTTVMNERFDMRLVPSTADLAASRDFTCFGETVRVAAWGSDEGAFVAAREVVRTIPLPTSVSAQAQEFLGAGFGMAEAAPSPSLDDLEGWRALIEASNAGVAATFEMRTAGTNAVVRVESIGDVPVFVVTPDGSTSADDVGVFLDVHGGAFTMGYGDACRAMTKLTAAQVQITTWGVDYRTPPDHPYPAALDDCLAVYRGLLDVEPPERIVVGGQSAGGNLALALMLRARDEGLPLPAALALLSPEADLTESGDSFATLLGVDPVLTSSLSDTIALYAGDHDLTDPYLSPLFGDFAGFPPTLVQAGTRDLFLSNAVRVHRAMRSVGVDAELHVFEAMPHGGFFGAPEDDELGREVHRFVRAHLGTEARAPRRGTRGLIRE